MQDIKEGDIVVVENVMWHDRFSVCRVVKRNPSMWVVETMTAATGTWSEPRKRTVRAPVLYGGPLSAQELAAALDAEVIQFREDERKLKSDYHARIRDIATAV